MLVRSMSATTGSTWTDELIAPSLRAAASALGRFSATSCSSNSTCRCRLCVSIKSRSTRRRWPTPARTRALASTVPRAPQPHRVTWLSSSRRWPASPMPPKRICRLYRSREMSMSGLWLVADAEVGQEGLEEVNVLLGPAVLARESNEGLHVLLDAVQQRAAQTPEVNDEVLQGLVAGGRLDHILAGANQEDDRVQRSQEQRVDAQLGGDQREDRRPVRHLDFLEVVGHVSLFEIANCRFQIANLKDGLCLANLQSEICNLQLPQPPATAGMMFSSSPSLTAVLRLSR